jgi:hypothetical protein
MWKTQLQWAIKLILFNLLKICSNSDYFKQCNNQQKIAIPQQITVTIEEEGK